MSEGKIKQKRVFVMEFSEFFHHTSVIVYLQQFLIFFFSISGLAKERQKIPMSISNMQKINVN